MNEAHCRWRFVLLNRSRGTFRTNCRSFKVSTDHSIVTASVTDVTCQSLSWCVCVCVCVQLVSLWSGGFAWGTEPFAWTISELMGPELLLILWPPNDQMFRSKWGFLGIGLCYQWQNESNLNLTPEWHLHVSGAAQTQPWWKQEVTPLHNLFLTLALFF